MPRYQLITRKTWGARPPRSTQALPFEQARGVAIHYSASQSPQKHADCFKSVRWIQDFHMDERGWQDVAYSHIVCAHGKTFRCRGIGKRTAANGTNQANSHYYAICYLGTDNANRADFTDAAKAEIAFLLHDLYLPRIGKGMRVRSHSDFTSTECPGDEIRKWIALRRWLKP